MRHRLGARVSATLLAPFFVVFLVGCPNGASTDTYELSGYVTEDFTGTPLSGARVTFTSDTLFGADTTTDGSGQYRLTIVTDDLFGQVRAELDGYQPREKTVFFDGPVRRIDLTLRPAM